jgi:type IV pilus assembly protein PilZ
MAATLSAILGPMSDPVDDRRSDDRAPIRLRVDYKRLNTFFADYTRNISKGGTFIRTGKPLDVGTEFVFVLSMPGKTLEVAAAEIRLELKGVVKWVVTEGEASAERPAGMGIQFVFNTDKERSRVEELVADLMRDSLGEALAEKLLAKKTEP